MLMMNEPTKYELRKPDQYFIPVGVQPTREGCLDPNTRFPCYSMVHGKFIALHRFREGDLWVVFQHRDGAWVTLRRPSETDIDDFVMAGAVERV